MSAAAPRAAPHGSRAPRWVCVSVLLAAPLLLGAACPRKPADCEHDSLEKCNWDQAVGATGAKTSEDSGGTDGVSVEGGEASEFRERDDLDDTVLGMIEVMGAGLEWELMDERARELCRAMDGEGELITAAVEFDEAPAETSAADSDGERREAEGAAWHCRLDWLEITGEPAVLEASDGVISLSLTALDIAKSEAAAAFARARFDDRCVDDFEVYEGAKLDEFHRCALPEGPYLVVARFPTDAEATLWQVSIAVVDAG